MDYKDLDYQRELIIKHLAKSAQCTEYGKFDDALVHTQIAEVLFRGYEGQGDKIAKYNEEVRAL